MINGLIRLAIEQRFPALMLVALLAGLGVYNLRNLPIDALPDVTNVQVEILTSSPALPPLEVERQITFPIEVAMSGLPKIRGRRGPSKLGRSWLTVVFAVAVDICCARRRVFERRSQARSQIPASLGEPEMGPISTGLGEIYQYELRAAPGGKYDL